VWGIELMFSQLISVGVETKVVKGFGKINLDTTVQEKAIAFPTDVKLYYRMREKLVRGANRHGVVLRQTAAVEHCHACAFEITSIKILTRQILSLRADL